jgi:hypothetical protein
MPVKNYLDAMKKYEEKRQSAKIISDKIGDMSEALKYKLDEFLHFNCGIRMSISQERLVDKIRFDLPSWPDGEAIKTTFSEFHAAHKAALDAWRSVPKQDQIGLQPPPQKLSTI